MSPFYLTKNEHGYYRACFVNQQTGVVTVAKSTHTKNKTEAMMIATDWYKNGVPKGTTNSRTPFIQNQSSGLNLKNLVARLTDKEAFELYSLLKSKLNLSETTLSTSSDSTIKTITKRISTTRIKLYEFMLNFWDYDNSEFIQRYIAHGNNMTKGHAKNMQSLVRNYWLPYFGEEAFVDELDKTMLDDFFFYLYREKGLKGGTVNKAINCGSRAMRYLYENHKISENPMAGVERFNPNQLERGIPTETEVRQLLNLEWSTPAYKLAFKLGVFCGLRAGEVSGLRVCDLDLDADIIHIRHSWSDTDGLKCPKNSDVRDLPLHHSIILELMAQAKQNPLFGDLSFVFWSNVKPEQPYGRCCYIDGLCEALEAIGISEEQRRERNIVFHSLRHFCATVLAQRADMKTVQAFMGHRTEAMSKHYSDHDSQEKLQNMKNIMQITWEEILSA
ncbi:MAG: site-specific integrase [Treponema sp.]|nr:site-specific integrase [Treponema sp.]